jgi:hypothetical protein
MAEPLSAADRSSLAAEQGPVTMGVGGLLVFEAVAELLGRFAPPARG